MGDGRVELLYIKCAYKLERILTEQDCDLRILVGHSNMLTSLMPTISEGCGYHDEHGEINEINNHVDDEKWEYAGLSSLCGDTEPNLYMLGHAGH